MSLCEHLCLKLFHYFHVARDLSLDDKLGHYSPLKKVFHVLWPPEAKNDPHLENKKKFLKKTQEFWKKITLPENLLVGGLQFTVQKKPV